MRYCNNENIQSAFVWCKIFKSSIYVLGSSVAEFNAFVPISSVCRDISCGMQICAALALSRPTGIAGLPWTSMGVATWLSCARLVFDALCDRAERLDDYGI